MFEGTLCQKVKAIIAFISGWRCEEVPVVLAYATVSQAGEVVVRCGDFEIVREDVGRYLVTAPAGAQVAIPTVVEGPDTRASIEIHMGTSFTGGTVHISEGDNGANPNTPRDRPWSIVWYGKALRVVCSTASTGGTDNGGGEGTLSEDYIVRGLQNNGFFNTDQMNAQLQIFNTATTAGVSSWEIRIEDANYDITSFTPSGATAGAIQKTDNGSTYSYVIPMTGSIPGNNGNVQVAIQGVRHPNSTDTTASVGSTGVYV